MAKQRTGDPETDRLLDEAEELRTGKKVEEKATSNSPVLTFLEYQQKAAMHNNYQNMTVPVLGMQAAVGRLAVAAMRRTGSNPINEEVIAQDLAHLLYYLSAVCDQNVVTLQKIAEISLQLLKQHEQKKLKG